MWCKGSTNDFDSFCIGSNPIIASKFKTMNSYDYYLSRVNYYNIYFSTKKQEPIKVSKSDRILIALMKANETKKKKSWLDIIRRW